MDNQNTTTVSDSYIRDVTFPSGYNANQNPLKIHYICVLSGYEKGTLSDKFSYCDLGCGNGVTLNLLASMYPHAKFTGVDFNQEHVEHAIKLAESAEIKNVTYYKEDFTNLNNLDLTRQDFICCNGTFSWVNTQIQEIINDFVGNTLAKNGKFYVEYAAKPGKIQMDPLWHFLREMTLDSSEDSSERVKLGIKYLESLRKNNALFFKQNPVAHIREKTLPRENVASIAHNALTEWQALNHSEIARSMEKYGISFAGQADLIQNHLELHIPKVFFEEINSLKTSILRETLKDYILNRGLRRDIYINNNNKPKDNLDRFNKIVFGVGKQATQPLKKYDFGNAYKINFNEKIYKTLVAILKREPQSLSIIKKDDELKIYGDDQVIHALQMLVAVGYIILFKSDAEYKEFNGNKNIVLTSKLSEQALKEYLNSGEILCLPSKNTGQVEHLGPVMSLFIKSLLDNQDNDPVTYACDFLGNRGFPIFIQNSKFHNVSELKKMLESIFKIFNENILPDLARLEIIKSID